MNLATWGRFLWGEPEAVRVVATSRGVLGWGLVAVTAAALAREYDGVDLLTEPWHLALPLVASVGSSLILFLLLEHVGFWRDLESRVTPLRRYGQLLAIYWATAPLAWLYAIPVERLLPAPDAARANIGLLGLVALWRVVIMVRAVRVLYGASLGGALSVVMFFADSLLLASLFMIPIPIVSIMGGVRLSEAEQIVQGTMFTLGFVAVVMLPIWFVCYAVTCIPATEKWKWLEPAPDTAASNSAANRQSGRISLGAWVLVSAALVAGLAVLPITQPPQRLKTLVERQLRRGELSEALALMSTYQADDFPAHWEPPPRLAYGGTKPDLFQVLEVIVAQDAAPWVRAVYVDKLIHFRDEFGWHMWAQQRAEQGSPASFLNLLTKLRETPDVLRASEPLVSTLKELAADHPEHRDQIAELLRTVGVELEEAAQSQDEKSAVESGVEGTEGTERTEGT